MHPKVSIAAIAHAAYAIVIVACATKSPNNHDVGAVTSAERTVSTEDASHPTCPRGMLPLCAISNIDLSEGGPRPSDQCTPLIQVELGANDASFTWSSPSGQLVDAVIVRSGSSTNVYAYDPSVSSDDSALVAPTHNKLSHIDFCGTLGAHGTDDASAADGADPPTNDGGKTW